MMNLRTGLGTARRKVLNHFCSRPVSLGEAGPIVSFSFDDFPRSAYTVGGSVLQNHGVRGTYYVTPSLRDKTNNLGEQYRLEDVHNLMEQGHELGSHTLTHLSCWSVPLDRFREDANEGRKAILDQMVVADSGNFAYPYGAVTLRAKKALGRVMRSCRGTTPGINGPRVDLNLLRANSLYGEIARLESMRRLIEQNAEKKGWLIFYTHDVSSRPSRFGCTPALLEAVVSFATKKSARIATVHQVLSILDGGGLESALKVENPNCAGLRDSGLATNPGDDGHSECRL